jgi:hypothetical protein
MHPWFAAMAWKRSVDSSRAGPEIQPRRLTRDAHSKLVADLWTAALTATAHINANLSDWHRTFQAVHGSVRTPCPRPLWSAVADRGSAKRIAAPMRTADLPTSDGDCSLGDLGGKEIA